VNISLTGASGGIGNSFLEHLLKKDHSITATYFNTDLDSLEFSEKLSGSELTFRVLILTTKSYLVKSLMFLSTVQGLRSLR